jgi:GT2 family glycosyltransferase
MDITVIIPCGRPGRLPPLLAALRNQTVRPAAIIVVSAAADTQSGAVTWVQTPELYPPGRMRNIGAARARTSLLAFIDDDCLPPPEWLERMLPILNDVTVGGVGCRVAAARDSFWDRCADYALFNCYQGYKRLEFALGSAVLAVREEAFRQIGGFDESLLASEDWDFSLKLQRAGWRCWFAPEVEVRHDHGRGRFGAILRQAFLSGSRSGLTVLHRHYQHVSWLARLSVLLASPFLYWLLILPYAVLTSTSQTLPALFREPRVIAFWPIVMLSRMAYHAGVLRALCRPVAAPSAQAAD